MESIATELSRDRLLAFLRDEVDIDTGAIDDGTLLFSSGLADSFMLMNLLAFVEQEQRTRIGVADVTLDNFDSVAKILAFTASLPRRG